MRKIQEHAELCALFAQRINVVAAKVGVIPR